MRTPTGIATAVALLLMTGMTACDSTPYPTGESFTTTVATIPDGVATASRSTGSPIVLDIRIADGTVTPANAELSAAVGQPIELRVTSDRRDQLRVHTNPERTFPVVPDQHQVFQFSADAPGHVEVDLRDLGRTVATIDVTA